MSYQDETSDKPTNSGSIEESSWIRPTEQYHAHFDCFSGAAGDMLLASCLDSCDNEEHRQQLLAHVIHCLENGMPELKGEFGVEMKKVWRGMGSIAAIHVDVSSSYNHEAAPVPTMANNPPVASPVGHDHSHSHGHGHSHSHQHSTESAVDDELVSSLPIQSTFQVTSSFQEKDAEVVTMLLKENFSQAKFVIKADLSSKMISMEHDSNVISARKISTFLRDVGFEVSEIGNSPVDYKVPVDNDEAPPAHSHSHGHSHGHSHSAQDKKLRNLSEIQRMLEESSDDYIAPWVRTNAISAFTELAKAEAHTHGVDSLNAVHFHEVGAVDSIVDTVGTLIALHALGVTAVSASKLPIGEGMVWTDHGCLPVPAPATLRLLIDMPVCKGPPGITGELVTPTGAALLRALTLTPSSKKSKMIGRPPDDFIVRKVGVGAGTKDFVKHPNILRLLLGTMM